MVVGLLAAAGTALLAAVSFTIVGWELSRREYPQTMRRVGVAFGVWWFAVAFMAASDAARLLIGAAPFEGLAAYVTLARLKIFAAAVGIWCLGYYVIYLWTGGERGRWGLAAFAAAHASLFLYLFERRMPIGYDVGQWGTTLRFASESGLPTALGPVVFLFFFLPPLVLIIAYLGLVPKLDSRPKRWRIGTIGASVLAWNVGEMVQFAPAVTDTSPVVPAFMVINAVAAILVYMTYRPPAWLTTRFGVRDVEDTSAHLQQ